MLGAIIGDTIGSVFERIPKLQQSRKTPTPTDDSFLTCACHDWIHSFKNTNLSFILDDKDLQQELFERGIKYLKQWGKKYEKHGFSRGFIAWVNQEEYEQTQRHTNGCIMRQSPIAAFCFDKSYSIEIAEKISEIFCSITHNHPDSLNASRMHTRLIYKSLEKTVDQKNLKSYIETNFGTPKSIEEWSNVGEFIWDAKRSFEIALSCIYYADSFEKTIQNCIDCTGDTDTYAAISGPVAQSVWGIEKSTIEHNKQYCSEFTDILKIYPKLKTANKTTKFKN